MLKNALLRGFPVIILFLLVIYPSNLLANTRALGARVWAAKGADPDIAVDADYALHLAYVRDGDTYYRKVNAPYHLGNLGAELKVGEGINPQIALDSRGIPHIAFGKAHYSYLSGGKFTKPVQAFSGWRKNLIAIDGLDRVYVLADRFNPRDVLVRVYRNGQPITTPIVVGDDNPGGVAIDRNNVVHLTWRVGSTYYNTFTIAGGKSKSLRSPNSAGDFSWCSINPVDNRPNVVYTAAYAKGLHFHVVRNGEWANSLHFARAKAQTHEPDDVNPVSATDAKGHTYVTFRGGNSGRGHFAVIDSNGQLVDGLVSPIDPQFDTDAGGKMRNPNVFSNGTMNGAFVAWGTSDVYVRSIGFSQIRRGDAKVVIAGITPLLLKRQKDREVLIATITTLLLNSKKKRPHLVTIYPLLLMK